jgi:N-methylhydantoinase A/oxoprolinase/acetone carboxylase beta subunit
VIELFEQTLKNEAVGQILGKGYSPTDYTLLCYGGGGPLHVAGYTDGVRYREVLVPAWAAGFSAFGCACADFDYRYDQTVDLPLLPSFGEAERAGIGTMITSAWLGLQDRVAAEFAKSTIERERIRFTHAVRMQYYGQLNDIEFISPHAALEGRAQVDDLIAAFEEAYAKMYASSARSPEFGYLVTHVIVHGTVDVEKPALPQMPEQPGTPPLKARRPVHWGRASDGEFVETDIFQLEEIRAGNSIEGPAIVEHSATTFAVPPGRNASLDRHHIFHLTDSSEA